MADLKVALEDLREETAGSSRQVLAQARRRWAWAALLPVMLLVAGFIGREKPRPSFTVGLRYPNYTAHMGVLGEGSRSNASRLLVAFVPLGAAH